MNGFANAILSLLLSWIRALVNNMWRMLSSEDGGALYRFLAANWTTLVIILCVGGFVVDRIIYLIRWRPYYVWSTKLRRLRRVRGATPLDEPYGEPYDDADAPDDALAKDAYAPPAAQVGVFATAVYAPPAKSAQPIPSAVEGSAPYAPPTQAYTPPAQPYAPPRPGYPPAPPVQTPGIGQATAHYAPLAQALPKDHVPYPQPYAPPQDLEPVFDDAGDDWAEGDALVTPLQVENPAQGMASTFGAARPEPLAYLRDMQAGFARPVPPEQLYAPAAQEAAPTVPADAPQEQPEPVHPGLDAAAFRQNFGLAPAQPLTAHDEAPLDDGWADEDIPDDPAAPAPVFRPFTVRDTAPEKNKGALSRLAQKARNLVIVSDEDHKPTIHDLQSTVDVSQAFHEPVYPKPKQTEGGEE